MQPRNPTSPQRKQIAAMTDGALQEGEGTPTAAQQILQDATARRDELAAQWISASQVGARLDYALGRHNLAASQLRRKGRLLGVYVAKPMPGYRYPPWQFRPDGQPIEHTADILRVMRDSGTFQREPEGLRRTTGWGEAEWFLSAHALLDGLTPAEVLVTDPARVLRAARIEFGEDT